MNVREISSWKPCAALIGAAFVLACAATSLAFASTASHRTFVTS
jgi:hypothetical protein